MDKEGEMEWWGERMGKVVGEEVGGVGGGIVFLVNDCNAFY